MSLEDKFYRFMQDAQVRFQHIDAAHTGAINVAYGHLDNLYDTREELGVDADGEDFLSDYYVARVLDRVADELSSMHGIEAEDNAFWVELKAELEG